MSDFNCKKCRCLCEMNYVKEAYVPTHVTCNCLKTNKSKKRIVKLLLSNSTVEEYSDIGSTVGIFFINEGDENSVFKFKSEYEDQYDNKNFIIQNNVLITDSVFDYTLNKSYKIKVGYEGKKFTGEQEFEVFIKSKNESSAVEEGSDVQTSFSNPELSLKFENISLGGDTFFKNVSADPSYTIYNIQSDCEFDGELEVSLLKPEVNSTSSLMQIAYSEELDDIIFENITKEINDFTISGSINYETGVDADIVLVNENNLISPIQSLEEGSDACQLSMFTFQPCTITISGGNSVLNCGGEIVPQYDNQPCPEGQTRVFTGLSYSSSAILVGSECGCWEETTDFLTVIDVVATAVPLFMASKLSACAARRVLSNTIKRVGYAKATKQVAIRALKSDINILENTLMFLNSSVKQFKKDLVKLRDDISRYEYSSQIWAKSTKRIEDQLSDTRSLFKRLFGFSYDPDSASIVKKGLLFLFKRYSSMIDSLVSQLEKTSAKYIEQLKLLNNSKFNLIETEELLSEFSDELTAGLSSRAQKKATMEALEAEIKALNSEISNDKFAWETALSGLISVGSVTANTLKELNQIYTKKTCEEPKILNEENCECECPEPCPEGKVHNEENCECECENPPTCTGGKTLNEENCECECPNGQVECSGVCCSGCDENNQCTSSAGLFSNNIDFIP